MIKRRISTIIFILLAFLLQTTVFHKLALANVVPNLLLILTVCYSYMRGRTSGEVIGLVCGLMLDMMYGSVIGLYAFIFMTIGFLCGYCQKIYFTDNYILPCVLVGLSDLVLLYHGIFSSWKIAFYVLFFPYYFTGIDLYTGDFCGCVPRIKPPGKVFINRTKGGSVVQCFLQLLIT